MGFLDSIFGKKEPPEPPGKGSGPSFVAPPDNPPIPYTKANPTYAPHATDKLASDALSGGKSYTPPEGVSPDSWNKYHSLQRERLWGQESLRGEEGWPYEITRKEMAPDPRWNPATVDRPQRSPSNYRFTRPFDVSSAKYLNGNRFSQADIQDNGFQYTGTPISNGNRRNTYRTEPAPWDTDIVDKTAEQEGASEALHVTPETIQRSNRSWRL